MAPDIRSLLDYLRAPAFRYRDLHGPAAEARLARARRREGMTLVALVSLLPGVGRTTLAANLAVRLGRRGLRAIALDVDPRGTLSAHFRGRSLLSVPFDDELAPNPRNGARSVGRIRWVESRVGFVPYLGDPARAVREAGAACDAIILDTPSDPSPMLEQALLESDEIVVVLRPDLASQAALGPIGRLLDRLQASAWRGAPARYLVNQFDGRRPGDREAIAALRRCLGGRLLDHTVQEDVAVHDALLAGRCIEDVAMGSQVVADLDALAESLFPAAKKRATPRRGASPRGRARKESRGP